MFLKKLNICFSSIKCCNIKHFVLRTIKKRRTRLVYGMHYLGLRDYDWKENTERTLESPLVVRPSEIPLMTNQLVTDNLIVLTLAMTIDFPKTHAIRDTCIHEHFLGGC